MNSTEIGLENIIKNTENGSAKKKCCGIYKIVNKLNGNYYIGSSKNIFGNDGRWKQHIRALKSGRHHSIYLQRAWNKYGMNSFEFEFVETACENNLLEVEQKYLDIANHERHKTYNVSFSASGGDCPPEVMEKINAYWTNEKREERSVKMKGENNPFYGKSHTKEIQNACGKRFRGTKLSDVHKSKISRFGKYNAATDNRIYIFNNNITGENFKGMRIEFKILHPELSSKVDHWARSGCISLTGWSASLAQ